MHMPSRNPTLEQFRNMSLRGGGPTSFDTDEDRYRDGKRAVLEEYRSEAATMQSRLQRASRLMGTTIDNVIKRYGGKEGTREERVQRALESVEQEMGPEYRTTGVDYDDFMGGTGVHLAKPLNLETLGLHNQDTDNMLYAVKRFKRKVSEGLDNTQRAKDTKDGVTHPDRAPELVRSCATAGPNWGACDPLKPGECPPKELLIGTPYENVFSAEVGVPPNNQVRRCVPRELIREGGDDERKDRSLNKRLYEAIRVIARESSNIQKLAGWKTAAPCDAIPATALRSNQKTCDSMFFKEDRMPHRCIPARAAATLVQETTIKKKAEAARDNPTQNTCFDNPREYGHELQRQLFRIKRLRQSLQLAAEDAMKVSNFRNTFNRIAKNSKYSFKTTKGDGEEDSNYTWGHVHSYILDDSKEGSHKQVDELRKIYDCDDAVKEIKEQNKRLSGGGDHEDDDQQLAEELSQLLTGGAGECTDSSADCNNKLMRTLKILDRLMEAEQKFMEKYEIWQASYKKMLDAIEKDVKCRNNKQGICKDIGEMCPDMKCEEMDSNEMDKQCIQLGAEIVHTGNQGVTWNVDRIDDHANPVNFQYLVDSNLRSTYNSMEASKLRSCAAHSRTTQSDLQRLKRQFDSRQTLIGNQLKMHFPGTYRHYFRTLAAIAEERDRNATYGTGPLTAEGLKQLMREVLREKEAADKPGTPGTLEQGIKEVVQDSIVGLDFTLTAPTWAKGFLTLLTKTLRTDLAESKDGRTASDYKAKFDEIVSTLGSTEYYADLKAGGVDTKKLAKDITKSATQSLKVQLNGKDEVHFTKETTVLQVIKEYINEVFKDLEEDDEDDGIKVKASDKEAIVKEKKTRKEILALLKSSIKVYIDNFNRPVNEKQKPVTIPTNLPLSSHNTKKTSLKAQNTKDWKDRIKKRDAS